MKVFIAICCLVAVFGQEPPPCESPKQWEGRRVAYDRSKMFEERSKVSYDETNERVRIIEEVEIGQDRDYYDVLYLHNIGKEYRLNFKTRQCNVTELTRPFRPFGVPPGAEFEGSATLGVSGLPGEFITIENFAGDLMREKARYFGFVTSPDCYPVQTNFMSTDTGLVTMSFYDINVGITDPNVFIPPPECFK
ncbi:mammalian ependymin-related protein 1-like [Mytilus galloprovincialis]|uniref:mammalian ependymin-related protein 1-like n=1 Tax=Mytilus galloprovincialis TaxID=29158 RepID=UPI003F7C7EDC